MIQAKKIAKKFQSTLPVGGATFRALSFALETLDFNPRSPRRERQEIYSVYRALNIFQSKLPAGGATVCNTFIFLLAEFQSTLPAGGATFLPPFLNIL